MSVKLKKGFTLVELLVVIAIIVILASLLLPLLKKSRQRANAINCVSNLKQFAIAYLMFAEDHFENFPKDSTELYGSSGDKHLYPDYLNNAQVFWCPADLNHSAPSSIDISNYSISYRYVFGLKVASKAVVPIPMMSDWCLWNASLTPNRFQGNHIQGANTLYMDGSVRWVDYTQLDASFFSAKANPGPGKVACDNNGNCITLLNDGTDSDTWGQN